MQPLPLVAAPTLGARTVAELVAYAKANPGSHSIGNFGNGTICHLAAQAFKQATNIELLNVSYRGSTQMPTDLLGGRIHAAFDNLPASVEHIKSGALRALAVTSAKRSKAPPDVPAMAEFVSGHEALTIAGVGAPRRAQGDIIDKLNTEINAGLRMPSTPFGDLGSMALMDRPPTSRSSSPMKQSVGAVRSASGIKLN